jgi:predicted TIM-barrel fold metal-dependent hydrolase
VADIGDQIIISGDSHFAEPPDLFETRLPARLRDRAPRVVSASLADGREGEFFMVENLEPAGVAGVLGAGSADILEANKLGYAAAPKSVWDPAERIKEQDLDTISAEVLYSSWGMFLFSLDDDDLRAKCFTAFNGWASEYCSHDPNRLKGLGLCDVTDPATAVGHLEQIKRTGLSGALVTGSPEDERPYFIDDYEPVWAAAADLGVPLSMHILTGAKGKGGIKHARMQPNGKPSPAALVHYVTNVLGELQASLGHMIASGVFDRYPTLKLIMAETDVGWQPHFIYRMDHFLDTGHGQYLTQQRRTGEYFADNIFSTAQFETTGFQYAVEQLGADHFMWSTDYPHYDCRYPNDRAFVGNILAAGFKDDDVAMILRGTAAELYGIDVAALPVPAAV